MITDENWKQLVEDVKLSKNVVQVGNLAKLVRLYSDGQYQLYQKDKEYIYETFKSLYDD